MSEKPYDPFDPTTWSQSKPGQSQEPTTNNQPGQNSFQQPNYNSPPQPINPDQPNYNSQNPYYQNPYQQPNYNSPPQPNYYPPQNFNPQFPGYTGQPALPNSGAVQVCGIIGLILSFGLFGIILNIIALVMGANAVTLYNQNPGYYTEASFRKVKTGRTCAIIGLSLFGLGIVILIGAGVAGNL